MQTALNNLPEAIQKVFQWLSVNYPVGNANKCHLLTYSKTAIDIHTSDATVSNEKIVKLLGINLEGRLNFDFHVARLINKGQ